MSFKYSKNVVDKFSVKGTFDDNAEYITFETKEGNDVTIRLKDYLDQFASQKVEVVVKTSYDEDLYLPDEE